MPYKLSDNGLCVHKQNADGSMGGLVKCHNTPEEAAAHMAALYANVEDAATKAYTGRLGDLLVAKIHQAFTVAADQLAQRGYLLQDQRIALSGVIGDLLGQFNKMIDPIVADYPVDGVDMGEIAEKEMDAWIAEWKECAVRSV